MQVILLQRVEKLGQMGDVVTVKTGFARNYLLPKSIALRANKANIAHFESQKAGLAAANAAKKVTAEQQAATMQNLSVILVRQAGENNQLFGSVTARDIADAVTAAGHKIDRSTVSLETPVKKLGLFNARVILHPEVSVTVQLNIARSEDEAHAQLTAAKTAATAEAKKQLKMVDVAAESDDSASTSETEAA